MILKLIKLLIGRLSDEDKKVLFELLKLYLESMAKTTIDKNLKK